MKIRWRQHRRDVRLFLEDRQFLGWVDRGAWVVGLADVHRRTLTGPQVGVVERYVWVRVMLGRQWKARVNRAHELLDRVINVDLDLLKFELLLDHDVSHRRGCWVRYFLRLD